MPAELRTCVCVFLYRTMYDEEMFFFILKKTLESTRQFERNTLSLRHTPERDGKGKRNCNANTLDYFNLPECTLPFWFFFSLFSVLGLFV